MDGAGRVESIGEPLRKLGASHSATTPPCPSGFRPRIGVRGRLFAGITMALRRPHKRMKIATRVSRS